MATVSPRISMRFGDGDEAGRDTEPAQIRARSQPLNGPGTGCRNKIDAALAIGAPSGGCRAGSRLRPG
jgi:hypothetical protein